VSTAVPFLSSTERFPKAINWEKVLTWSASILSKKPNCVEGANSVLTTNCSLCASKGWILPIRKKSVIKNANKERTTSLGSWIKIDGIIEILGWDSYFKGQTIVVLKYKYMKMSVFVALISLLALPFYSLNAQSSDLSVILIKVDSLIMADNVAEASQILEKSNAKSPTNYELLWRLSRVETLLGESDAGDEDKEIAHYNKALELAELAIRADKNGSMGYIRRAAANGKLALFQGVLTANSYVNAVLDDAEKAIKLKSADEYNMATAYYILGRTHLKLSETPVVLRMPLDLDWGNIDEAVEYLEKAVKMRPAFIMYRYDFARALIEYDEEGKAKAELLQIANIPNAEPGDDARRVVADKLLKSLK